MKNLLIEELEKFRKLANYDTKLTLTENETKILDEFRVNGATRDAVRAAVGTKFDDFVRTMKITSRSADDVAVLVAKSADEFDNLFIKAMQKDLKDGFPKGTLGPAAKEMSKIDVLRQLAGKSLSKPGNNRRLTPQEIDSIINSTSAANKLKAAQFTPKPPKTPRPKPDPQDVGNAVTKFPYLKNLDWKSLLKKGAVLGLGVAVLYGIYKLTHDDEPPLPPDPDVDPNPNPNPDPNTSKYRDCTGTYVKWCKTAPTGPIGIVQGCLGGLVVDGKFGNRTQSALEAKGYPNGFKDSDITKICGGNTPTPPKPEPSPEEQLAQDYGVTPQPNAQAEVQTTNDDINNY